MHFQETRSTDSPIESAQDDRFDRYKFATTIASYLAAAQDPASFAVGLYGSWGSGKTSVLNFIEQELLLHQQIRTMKFNPWMFDSEAKLLSEFFECLSDLFQKSNSARLREAGLKLLTRYGGVLAAGLKLVSPIDAQGLVSQLPHPNLQKAKKDLGELLKQEGTQFVVLMDDIDRLDDLEIQSVFRLVKLTGDLPNLRYVLAFDQQIVAAALDKRYHSGGQSGSNFLEKIVQLPVHMPVLRLAELHQYFASCVNEACKVGSVSLSAEQRTCLDQILKAVLSQRITTPRIAKRYGYSLGLAFKQLRDEVDPLDLSVLEALRVLYPTAYEVLRDQRASFLYTAAPGDRKFHLDKALVPYSGPEREMVNELLTFLFPVKGQVCAWDRPIGSLGDSKLEEEARSWNPYDRKQIAEPFFLDRYFSYSIGPGEISEQPIAVFLAACRAAGSAIDSDTPTVSADTVEELLSPLEDVLRRSTPIQFLAQIGQREFVGSASASYGALSYGVALALVSGYHLLCAGNAAIESGRLQHIVCVLMSHLVDREDNTTLDSRGQSLLRYVISRVSPLIFADAVYGDLTARLRGEDPSSSASIQQMPDSALMESLKSECCRTLSARFAALVQSDGPEGLWAKKRRETLQFLYQWQQRDAHAPMITAVSGAVATKPERVWTLLDWFPPEFPAGPGAEISKYADVGTLERILRNQIGDEYDSKDSPRADSRVVAARRFRTYLERKKAARGTVVG